MPRLPGAVADLVKYKLSLAVVLSAVTGYFLASGEADIKLIRLAAGVFLLSAGSAALNQYTERETDALMPRTRNRPIPSDKIALKEAIVIISLLLLSGCLLLFFNGLIPLLTGIVNVLLYNVVYTGLKKKTVLSIIPGALVGALPPMIGFSSAGGSLLHPYNIAFSVFMFLWQLPHFWLIIIRYGKEYSAAGLASISKYLNDTQIRYLVFFWVLLSTSLLILFFTLADLLNLNIFILLSLLNILFIVWFHRLLFRRNRDAESRKAFILINVTGVMIMLILIIIALLEGL
jgi:heme o synthase